MATSTPPSSLESRSPLPFSKLHGAGNDFVVVDGRSLAGDGWPVDWAALAQQVCDRNFGVGADGLLVAAEPELASARFRMRMYNPDGSESEMCGNGLRCFVRWLYDRGEAPRGTVPVQTGAGLLSADLADPQQIVVDMGRPRLAPSAIPLSPEAAASLPSSGPVLDLHLPLSPQSSVLSPLLVSCVSMGNPHAVAFVPDVAAVPLDVLGPLVEHHPSFPERTNFEICQVVAPDHLRVRVWERGAGLTLACGTGACAVAVAARLHGLAGEHVAVELPGGVLEVDWRGTERPGGQLPSVKLSGATSYVFDGAWRAPLPRLADSPAGVPSRATTGARVSAGVGAGVGRGRIVEE